MAGEHLWDSTKEIVVKMRDTIQSNTEDRVKESFWVAISTSVWEQGYERGYGSSSLSSTFRPLVTIISTISKRLSFRSMTAPFSTLLCLQESKTPQSDYCLFQYKGLRVWPQQKLYHQDHTGILRWRRSSSHAGPNGWCRYHDHYASRRQIICVKMSEILVATLKLRVIRTKVSARNGWKSHTSFYIEQIWKLGMYNK